MELAFWKHQNVFRIVNESIEKTPCGLESKTKWSHFDTRIFCGPLGFRALCTSPILTVFIRFAFIIEKRPNINKEVDKDTILSPTSRLFSLATKRREKNGRMTVGRASGVS